MNIWKRIKESGVSAAMAFGLFLSAIVALVIRSKHKDVSKWQDRAVDSHEQDVVNDIEDAKRAQAEAEKHDQEAREALERGKDELERIAHDDSSMADVLDDLHRDRVRRNT